LRLYSIAGAVVSSGSVVTASVAVISVVVSDVPPHDTSAVKAKKADRK
jgi:hypothetical protein